MKKEIVKLINKMQGKYNTYELFMDWVKCMAISIHNACHLVQDETWRMREQEYLKIITKYNKEERDMFAQMFNMLTLTLENNITDALGEIYMAGCGNKGTGQFFTPFHVSEMMVRLNLPDKIEGKLIINEPSCGAGGMLVAMCKYYKEKGVDYQHKVKVIAQDLDWNAVYMTYVQISLLGVDGIVYQGDTLCDPDTSKYSSYRVFETPARMGLLA